MEKLFVQFYNPTHMAPSLGRDTIFYENGLSPIWDFANPIWIDSSCSLGEEQKKAFLKADEIYISVWSWSRYRRVYGWARAFQEKKFIIGGPLIRFFARSKLEGGGLDFSKIAKLPPNIEYTSEVAEEYFGIKSRWRLVLPDITNYDSLYSYHLEDGCYWNKCTFCHYQLGHRKSSLEHLWDAPPGHVWLESPSVPPEFIGVLPTLNYDKHYQMFIRAEAPIYEALKRHLPQVPRPENLLFRIGVEFPSNRMLKIMQKGLTVEEILRVSNLIYESGCKQMLLFICEWPELTYEDFEEAKEFFNKLADKESWMTLYNASRMIYFATNDTLRDDTGNDAMAKRYWYFRNIDGEAKKANKMWLQYLIDKGIVENKYFDFTLTQKGE